MGNRRRAHEAPAPADLRDTLEAAFAMRFGDAEAAACRTVGDLFEAIRARFPPGAAEAGCAKGAALRILGRAFAELGATPPPEPDARLDLVAGLSARRLLRGMERRSGLRLPAPHTGLAGRIGVAVMVAGAVVAGLGWLPISPAWPWFGGWWAGAVACAAGLGLVRADPGRLPRDCRTLDGLARRAVGLNISAMAAHGATPNDGEVFDALRDVLADYTDLPRDRIDAVTPILQGLRRGQ